MSRENVSTPERGSTWYNGRTIDTNNYEGTELEGQIKVFEDINWGDYGVKSSRSARKVVCMLVRNTSGQTLYGKRLVTLDPTTRRITGYADTLAEEAFPLDEFLPSTGLLTGDMGWVVVSGPAIVLTPMTGAEFITTSIAAGDPLVAMTTSGASTAAGTTGSAGRLAGVSLAALTTAAQGLAVINHAINCLGKAMSAATSGQTNAALLVDVGRPRNMW